MKIKLENICEMCVTLKSNNKMDFVVIKPKESHIFESEKELAKFSESVRVMVFSKFLKKIEDVKVTKPGNTVKVIDEDLSNAIADIKKEISDLKVKFKATDDKSEKRDIKAKIKELNETIKTLSK